MLQFWRRDGAGHLSVERRQRHQFCIPGAQRDLSGPVDAGQGYGARSPACEAAVRDADEHTTVVVAKQLNVEVLVLLRDRSDPAQ